MNIPELKVWENGIIQVSISMSPPLRWVNSYIIRGVDGVTLLDPGPRTEQTEQEWERAMDALGMSFQDITSIVITHHHPDHYGLAGYLQSRSGAKVWMSKRAYQETELMWGTDSTINEQILNLYIAHGMPKEWSDLLPGHLESFSSQVLPAPEVSFLEEGAMISMGDRMWSVIESNGHAPGHLSLYEPDSQTMLCGDAVLPGISPNISILPGSDPQPLQSYMASLMKLGEYEVKRAYPGHRHPFDHFTTRTRDLIHHHEERLSQIEELLIERPRSGFDMSVALFGTKFGIHQMRFAMSETLAHLVELVRQGRAAEQQSVHESCMYTYISTR